MFYNQTFCPFSWKCVPCIPRKTGIKFSHFPCFLFSSISILFSLLFSSLAFFCLRRFLFSKSSVRKRNYLPINFSSFFFMSQSSINETAIKTSNNWFILQQECFKLITSEQTFIQKVSFQIKYIVFVFFNKISSNKCSSFELSIHQIILEKSTGIMVFTKILSCTTVFNIDKKCFLSSKSAYRMISEGSCDTKD